MKEKKEIILKVLNILTIIFFGISSGLFVFGLIKLNIIPTKYLFVGFSIVLFTFAALFYFIFSKKKKISKVVALIVAILFSILFIAGTNYLDNTYHFFENTTKQNYDTLVYSILVLNEKNYNEISDLNEKNILYLNDDYKEDVIKELENKINYEELTFDTFGGMGEALLNDEVDAIVIEESYMLLAKEEVETFEEKTKVIYTFEVQVKSHKEDPEENENIHINSIDTPFILYISGIDTSGNIKNSRSRSDVNQLVVINPKTNHILLVNTPRDYYVQLAGTSGLKDKLTHAGVYGIDKSIKTLENFYNIDVRYYVRVNFTSLIKIVDVIGGIEVESDKEFDSNYLKGWHVLKGLNHMDGKKALAYSRERYAYVDGDHHRGKNQQAVLTAIINKVTNSKVLISKYNSILKALEGSFQTDMPMEEMTSFIKYQLDKMPSWKIESIAVTGTGDMQPTYSMGSKLKLYVMNPDMGSVAKAKEKINEVFNEG